MNGDITVVKVGTGVLTKVADGTLDGGSLVRLSTALAALLEEGRQVILVSSGSVGAGVAAFGLRHYPDEVSTRQACAAVGQTRLMAAYESIFRRFDVSVAQLLLTAGDLHVENRRGLVLDPLRRLLEKRLLLPIVNENDSVAVEELKVGDNDMLSALVAVLVGARRLILLSTVDGLIDPATEKPIPVGEDLSAVETMASPTKGRFSIGGMRSKLKAIRHALDHGIETVIANGRAPEHLAAIIEGDGPGTRFRTGSSSA